MGHDGVLESTESVVREALGNNSPLAAMLLLVDQSQGIWCTMHHGVVDMGLLVVLAVAVDFCKRGMLAWLCVYG